jgi:hypothetical protein
MCVNVAEKRIGFKCHNSKSMAFEQAAFPQADDISRNPDRRQFSLPKCQGTDRSNDKEFPIVSNRVPQKN